jgi:hypothetical protein
VRSGCEGKARAAQSVQRTGCHEGPTIHFDRPPAGTPAPRLIRFPVGPAPPRVCATISRSRAQIALYTVVEKKPPSLLMTDNTGVTRDVYPYTWLQRLLKIVGNRIASGVLGSSSGRGARVEGTHHANTRRMPKSGVTHKPLTTKALDKWLHEVFHRVGPTLSPRPPRLEPSRVAPRRRQPGRRLARARHPRADPPKNKNLLLDGDTNHL